ncbi:sigma-70 family RNA polymerase sigma factor [Pendulispora rubella]|uniref:Sigma-70 family RNA polymerase sigma factor n=1 Tax=Pendulispora rubella TaxID=2741070 RepID=A0ABZ2L330_9BACT
MADEEADARLARQAATDATARDAIARRLGARVRRLCRSLIPNADDSDDAAQLALLDIVQSAPGFRGECTLEAWADRIAVRTAIRVARQRRLASVRSQGAIEPDDLTAPGPSNKGADGIPRSILAYLDELPEARRTVLVLHHVMGCTVQEIAEVTAVSVNTVKDRLLAAREQVRRMVRRDLATFRRAP